MNLLPNDERVLQRKILLIFIGICIPLGLGYSILHTILFYTFEGHRGGLTIENFFYVFAIGMLFTCAFRDYKMFGSGLKEYYLGGCKSGTRRKLRMTGY